MVGIEVDGNGCESRIYFVGARHDVPVEGNHEDYSYEIENSSSLFQFIGLVMMYS